ncbi:hypothetical protein [Saccharothrix sp. ST-888]|uniref:hypothetical protein n=1 Tax=Saccharothrix sp. ST-888 TaxID=1427391 RepID=UPI0005ED221C|nr:hypothetical protein [Saccharothrix sp. ST-888]KJK55027.1 hypothetical protein UK12_31270 [Saccharothrix sp. ST-888]
MDRQDPYAHHEFDSVHGWGVPLASAGNNGCVEIIEFPNGDCWQRDSKHPERHFVAYSDVSRTPALIAVILGEGAPFYLDAPKREAVLEAVQTGDTDTAIAKIKGMLAEGRHDPYAHDEFESGYGWNTPGASSSNVEIIEFPNGDLWQRDRQHPDGPYLAYNLIERVAALLSALLDNDPRFYLSREARQAVLSAVQSGDVATALTELSLAPTA